MELKSQKIEEKHAWLLTASLENWQIAEGKKVFGCHGNGNCVKKIKKEDYFIAFVPKVGFIGQGIVTGEYFNSNIKLWEDKNYNNKFQISAPFISDKVLPAASIVDDLSFVTNKEKWGVFFRSGIREIPLVDYSLISKRLDKSVVTLSVIDKNIQKENTATQIGSELHNRVEILFENLGFSILESNYFSAGPDIIVQDPEDINKSKIIIQCKNSNQKANTFSHLDKHLNEYSGRLRSGDAQAAILVIAGQKLPRKVPGETGDLNIEDILKKYNVAVWTEETLSYYEELIKKISHFARYQVLSDLGMKLAFSEDIKIDAVKIVQNGYTMYATSLDPNWLLKTASVIRRVRFADGPKGYQRLLDKNRIKNSDNTNSISNYIDSHPKWLFPNAVVLASSRKMELNHDNGKLSLKSNYGQFWVIDGQHRLFAFANTDARNKGNQLLCVIVDSKSLGSEEDEERELAQIFVTLNGKSKKVPKALLYELYRLLGSEDNPRLEIVLQLAEDKFFSGCIRGYSDKGGSINLVAFADAKAISSIYSFFKKEDKKDDKAINKTFQYILSSFEEVAVIFPTEWKDPDEYFLKTDRGVRGMLELFSTVLNKYGSNDSDTSRVLHTLKDTKFDFASETAKGLYLGAGGPVQLARALSKHINKKIFDFFPDSSRRSLTPSYFSTRGEIPEAFLREWMGKLNGNVRCFMMFIDLSTLEYLRYVDITEVKQLRLFFGNCYSDEKKMKEKIKNLLDDGLNIILTQVQKKTTEKGGFFHERWIGDDKMQISTNADLTDSGQRGSAFHIKVDAWENPAEIEDFDRYWIAAEMNKDFDSKYDWGNSLN